MALHQRIGGVWKDCVPWVNVSGTWKKAAVWQRIGGVWKQITFLVTLPSSIYALAIGATSSFSASSGGTWSATGDPGGTWLGGGSASAYDIRWTNVSGSPNSGTTGTWLNLGTTRTWSKTTNGSAVGTVEIRLAASPYTVVATSTVTIERSV